MPLDLSSLLVLVEPEGGVAQTAFYFPENAKCRHYGLAIDALADEGHEAEIDFSSQIIFSNAYVPVHLALNFNQIPKDVSKGFVFGSDPETCDVLLSMNNYTGVCGNHFSISVDWATGNPLITCLTSDDGSAGMRIKSGSLWELYLRKGWKVLDPGSTTTIKIFDSMQLLVYSPGRESRELAYNDNLRSYFKRCQNAVSEMMHLKLYDPEPTPLLVSRGRGLTGVEYFTTSTVVREKVVLCEAKSHQNLSGELFIVKRFRNVSDQWPKHAKTGLYKLRNLRHRNIIAPEDIITDKMEYMPVYLPEPPETLADRHTRKPLTLVEANQILAQVFEGLKFLHANGIVHGGLYPGSIRIDRSAPLSIRLSDIWLESYVDLEDPKEREYYACQPASSISEPMPKHDTWSAGVVGLNLILPGGLPPRPNLFHYDQSAWTASIAAQAKSFHASLRPGRKKDAALFLTRVLKHDDRERLTAEECLQDPWILLGQIPISDSQDPSDPFFYRSGQGGDAPLESLGGVEDDEGSGEVTDIEEPRNVTSKGKQPQELRQTDDTPSSNLRQQRTATSRSLGCAGLIPTPSRRTSVTPSSSSHQQRHQRTATPRSLGNSSVAAANHCYRDIKPSESISRESSDPISGIIIRGEYTLNKGGRGHGHRRQV